MIKAQLGLDPTNVENDNYLSATEALQRLSGEVKGDTVATQPASLDVALSCFEGDTNRSIVVLIDQNSHMYLVLGAIEIDGRRLYQIIHGLSAVALVTRDDIQKANFHEIWRFDKDRTSIPIKIGLASLTINSIYYNFGEVQPHIPVRHQFQIINTGTIPLFVEKPRTGCGCTSTQPNEAFGLQPNASQIFEVAIDPQQTPSIRQPVVLNVVNSATNSVNQIALWLYGSERELKKAVPEQINFGSVLPDVKYSQLVSINETAADRFEFTNSAVMNDANVVAGDISTFESLQGYKIYKLKCTLKVARNAEAGVHTGYLRLMTNSKYSSDVVIPFSYTVLPAISIHPHILAVGEIEVGKTYESTIDIVPRDANERLSLKLHDDNSPELKIERIDNTDVSGVIRLAVSVKMTRPGEWRSIIHGTVDVGNKAIPIAIQCVGYAVSS